MIRPVRGMSRAACRLRTTRSAASRWPPSTAASAHSAAYHGRHSSLFQYPKTTGSSMSGASRRCASARSPRCSASRPSKVAAQPLPQPASPGDRAGVGRETHPGLPALLVAAHAVHHGDGVRGTARHCRDWPARAFPADAEHLSSARTSASRPITSAFFAAPAVVTSLSLLLRAPSRPGRGVYGDWCRTSGPAAIRPVLACW